MTGGWQFWLGQHVPNLGIDLKLDIQAYMTRNLVKIGHTSFLQFYEVRLDDKV